MAVEPRTTGLFIHVGHCIPTQPASVMPAPSNKKTQGTTEYAAPDNHDVLQGDIFFLIKDNHIILCPSGLKESVAFSYIKYVLERVNQEHVIACFGISPVANYDKLKLPKRRRSREDPFKYCSLYCL